MRAPELLSACFSLFGTAALCVSAAFIPFGAPPPPELRTVRISFASVPAGVSDGGASADFVRAEPAEHPADCEMPGSAGTHGASERRAFAEAGAESVPPAEFAEISGGEARGSSEEFLRQERAEFPCDASAGAELPQASAASALPEHRRTHRNGGRGRIRTEAAVGTRNADGLLSVRTADGSARILLEPQKPVILISAESAALIDGSRTVRIQLTIRADGSVPAAEVAAVPAALLPAAVLSEAAAQISQWRFSPAALDGRAEFAYSIIKR